MRNGDDPIVRLLGGNHGGSPACFCIGTTGLPCEALIGKLSCEEGDDPAEAGRGDEVEMLFRLCDAAQMMSRSFRAQ
jgi:hypothetical protein